MVNLSSAEALQRDRTSPAPTIPPLESGDRLTREEFERRYAAMSRGQKAELIEGVVYVAAALRFNAHAEPHNRIATWLGVYQAFTPCVKAAIEPTTRLDRQNEPQPDNVLVLDAAVGGQTRLTEDGYLEGAPELAVEIAASSAAIDLNSKKAAYHRNGVQEYLVWSVFENRLYWFQWESAQYVEQSPDSEGIIQSRIFPGLWLSVPALLEGDMQLLLSVVQQGCNSEAHRQFLESMQPLK